MKKFSLINKNIKKTFSDYIIYFVTLCICSSLFFSFLSLSSDYNNLTERSTLFDNKLIAQLLEMSVYISSIVMVILVYYINNFMIKQRAKEFSVYMILGMKQKSIYRLYFIETIMIGIFATLIGIFIGIFLSGFLGSIVLISIGEKFSYTIGFYIDTIIQTILFFSITFLIIGCINVIRLKKMTLLQFINEKSSAEGKSVKNWVYILNLLLTIIFICSLTYCSYKLSGDQELSVNQNSSYHIIIFLSAIIGTFSFYYTISYIIKVIKEKNSTFKYKGGNSILIANLYNKISSNVKIVGGITLLIVISITSFIVAPIFSQVAKGYLDFRIPYDLIISNSYNWFTDIEDIPEIDYTFAEDIILSHGIEIEDSVSVKYYFLNEKDFENTDNRDERKTIPRLAIALSDYNKLRRMNGYDDIILNDDEMSLHISYQDDKKVFLKELKEGKIEDGAVLDNGLVLTMPNDDSRKVYNDSISEYIGTIYSTEMAIVPDNVVNDLIMATNYYYMNSINPIPLDISGKLSEEINAEFEVKYNDLLNKYREKYERFNRFIYIDDKTTEVSDITNINIVVNAIGIYVGVIFFIICLAIFATQQISEIKSNENKYAMLYKIGMERKMIYKSINNQTLIFFTIPIIIAMGVSAIVVDKIVDMFGYRIDIYVGNEALYLNIFITVCILIVILISYYIVTINTCNKIIDAKLDKNKIKL